MKGLFDPPPRDQEKREYGLLRAAIPRPLGVAQMEMKLGSEATH